MKLIDLFAKLKRNWKYFFILLKLRNKKYTHLYIGSPEHGNLGDQQIRNSALEILKYKKINYIEISTDMYGLICNNKMPYIKTICLHGGGNLGDEYMVDTLIRDDVIRRHKDKKIILFPQTLFYKDKSENGEIFVTKKIFDNHKDLSLCARETVSYQSMKDLFTRNKVVLTPDSVMFSDYTKKYRYKRKNRVMFLLRKDIEKTLSNTFVEKYKTEIQKKYKIVESDTVVNYNVYDILRNAELKKIFKKISKSTCVITDRLHGMIFCAITNTPCLVFGNYNHKIKSSYEKWLKDRVDYIKFFDNYPEDILHEIEIVKAAKSSWSSLEDEFKELLDIL